MDRIETSKVLVVDDCGEFLEIAFKKLSPRGYDILTALTSEDAIRMLKAEDDISAVLLDFNKANSHGLKVINYINTLSRKPTLIPLFS